MKQINYLNERWFIEFMKTIFDKTTLNNLTLNNRIFRSATWEWVCDR